MESTMSTRSCAPVLPLNCFTPHRSPFLAPPSHSSRNSSSSSAFNFSLQNSTSPNRNLVTHSSGSALPPKAWNSKMPSRSNKACMCSPTNHPGSFRCSLHRNSPQPSSCGSTNSQLQMRRSAMRNSLVRIGSVEGELIKRSLTALIRPSSHQMKRRMSFHPQPSRFRQIISAQVIPL